jgi:hypothetical protein
MSKRERHAVCVNQGDARIAEGQPFEVLDDQGAKDVFGGVIASLFSFVVVDKP